MWRRPAPCAMGSPGPIGHHWDRCSPWTGIAAAKDLPQPTGSPQHQRMDNFRPKAWLVPKEAATDNHQLGAYSWPPPNRRLPLTAYCWPPTAGGLSVAAYHSGTDYWPPTPAPPPAGRSLAAYPSPLRTGGLLRAAYVWPSYHWPPTTGRQLPNCCRPSSVHPPRLCDPHSPGGLWGRRSRRKRFTARSPQPVGSPPGDPQCGVAAALPWGRRGRRNR